MHPGKIVSTSQEVEVKVLDVDHERRRISLGLKQCMSNPWGEFGEAHPVGSIVEGEVKNITEFGMFIGLNGDIDGMAHLFDLDWRGPVKRPSPITRRAIPLKRRCWRLTSRRSGSASASSN